MSVHVCGRARACLGEVDTGLHTYPSWKWPLVSSVLCKNLSKGREPYFTKCCWSTYATQFFEKHHIWKDVKRAFPFPECLIPTRVLLLLTVVTHTVCILINKAAPAHIFLFQLSNAKTRTNKWLKRSPSRLPVVAFFSFFSGFCSVLIKCRFF